MTSILDEIQDFLKSELPTDKNKLIHELRKISELRAKLAPFIVDAHRELVINQGRFRRPAEKGLTDFDRRIMLQADVAEDQRTYDFSVDLSTLLADRREDSLSLYDRL